MKRTALWLLGLSACFRQSTSGVNWQPIDTCFEVESEVGLTTSGQLEGKSARIAFDTAWPMNSVTAGCLNEPMVRGSVTISRPLSKSANYPLAQVRSLTVAGQRVPALEAALLESQTTQCTFTFGASFLESLVLEYLPQARQLCFRAKVAASSADGAKVRTTVPLTRDVKGDWIMLPVQFAQGESTATLSALLSLSSGRSSLFGGELRRNNFVLVGEVVPGESLKEAHYDAVALGPAVSAEGGLVDVLPERSGGSFRAILGADVLSQFHFWLDVKKNGLHFEARDPRVAQADAGAKAKKVMLWQQASEALRQQNEEAYRRDQESLREPEDP